MKQRGGGKLSQKPWQFLRGKKKGTCDSEGKDIKSSAPREGREAREKRSFCQSLRERGPDDLAGKETPASKKRKSEKRRP